MKALKKPLLFALILLLSLPVLLTKGGVNAANNSLPYYNQGAVELVAPFLPEGHSSTYGRADKTIGINPILGQMRFPTMYDGKIGGSSYSSGLNSSFKDDWVGNIKSAHQNQPYYHLVPLPAKNSARNVIETQKVKDNEMRNVYNGNPEFMKKELPVVIITNKETSEPYGEFYYIVEIARYSGGVADNADASNNFDGVNPTWLRFVRTSWPDITKFTADSNEVNLGDSVRFSFDGFEYVSEGRTAVDATITISKNGAVESKTELSLHSTKPSLNPTKPNEEHAGKFSQKNVGAWSPSECGVYTAELQVDDEVKRFATESISITVEGDDCNSPPIIPPGPSCSLDIAIAESGEMNNREDHMYADPNGLITESVESKEFDVLEYGIPSSEYLKVWGQSEKYLTDYRYSNMTGSIRYTINVKKKYHLVWEEEISYDCSYTDDDGEEVSDTCYYYEDREDFEDRDIDFDDPYTLGYWQIGHLNVYSFIDAVFRNYALPDEEVIVPNPDQVTANSEHSAIIEDHVFFKDCENVDLGTEVIDGGYSRPPVPDESGLFEEKAELTSRTPDVKNDKVDVDDFLSMDNTLIAGIPGNTHVQTPNPEEVPLAKQVPVEQSSLLIDPLKVNKWKTKSSITARYKSIHVVNVPKSSLEVTGLSPDKINTVTVHTPVVMYARASDDKEHDQRTKPPERSTPPDPDKDRHAFILDRPFEVSLPTYGQHLDKDMAPGYGNRDFAKYFREKEIKFPFDVYTETKQGFYPKDTWIKIPIDVETPVFFMPVWVPEDEYTVDYRSIAINFPGTAPHNVPPKKESDKLQEHEANLNLEFRTPDEMMDHHVAYDTIKVDVVGRLYDFRVTDILDYRWGSVFRTMEGLLQHTGNYYWVGDKKIDGDLRESFKEPFRLPVRQGSHPKGYPNEMKNVAVKTGYQFKFEMKTKGNLWDSYKDGIRVTPSFYFVSKDGNKRQPVDIYYHSDTNSFVKVGSDQDKEYREVKLNEPLRNVPKKQLSDTADFYYRYPDEYGYRSIVDKYINPRSFIRDFDRKYAKRPIKTGPYGSQFLNWSLHTFVGPDAKDVPSDAMVSQEDVKAREQMWYGEYSLPADIYVVEKGREIAGYGLKHRLNRNSLLFLNDGYIIVNFNIETIDDGDTENPRLQYHQGPLNNQWDMEGFKYDFVDPYGKNFDLIDGDVIFYHGDQSSFDDFKSTVTH